MLPTWLPMAAFISAAAGPLSHYTIWMRHEFDTTFPALVPKIFISQTLLLFLIYWACLSVSESILSLFLLQISYLVPLFLSIAVYRLFLHPTQIFPGPFWARLSSWWKVEEFYTHKEQGFIVFHDLHQKYGDVYRIGPRHISINNVEAIAPIYGTGSVCGKSANYVMANQNHLQVLRDVEMHRHRRMMWDKGLNSKSCLAFLPKLNRLSNLFVAKLSESNGQPISITDWCHYVTFDVMGDLGFSNSYGQLESGQLHPAVAAIAQFLRLIVAAWQVPWFFNSLASIPGVQDPGRHMRYYSEICLRERKQNEPDEPDVMSYVFESYKGKAGLLEDDRTMVDDTFLLQVAGSDTTYSVLVHIFYYLAKYPKFQQLLREEVCDAVTSNVLPNWSALATLPLLDGVLNETLRMHPPVAQGMNRETPAAGAQIGPYWIPGETIVTVPTYTVQRDARYFGQPDEWIPERWFSRPELVLDRRALIPFSIGPFNCAGKNFATMEIKVLIAKVVTALDINFAPGEDGRDIMENFRDCMTLWLPALRLCLVPRDKT